ncbi:collagenase-like protein with putative collagen-binding domain [Sphingobacterium allocomposti]|uniref:Collagenase-like protein with putative collagen-binding domain n=1 Tax=Sphingobacterium allocomposti TaxID=415956 RepID=A0A5S5DIW1_9SPHI|nr:glycoside hydrolase family 140 protein [Sphingobacterium composti Yoo et al. 2007 non Ten et al. 2007]TYP95861.1 collagenase-like protein with putative collagen-binding domain [Sphingobacterium composti Yoo et al. 2007 non Ten et al. 2007]
MKIYKKLIPILLAGALFSCTSGGKQEMELLQVSENGRYLATADGKPFFWLGDTGWLLFNKLNRAEADQYLEDRKGKGFNVVQAMVLHTVPSVNVYGDSSIVNQDISKPLVTEGSNPEVDAEYDYWDHIDYIIDKAAQKGIYMALVPVWGTPVKEGKVSVEQARIYARFLAERWKDRKNIIWLNGGDIKGSDSIAVWQEIGRTIKEVDPQHLMTFHPRGRTASSDWFHDAAWLDFNMVQSGHRRYDQDTSANEDKHYGEDNWRFMEADWNRSPVKPTIDGEPSYEGIPQGLHDINEPRWTAADVRRYGYWSVFAGAFGYTYGQNSVMQMHAETDTTTAYGSTELWVEALDAPGAKQMQYLKKLMLSRDNYFGRIPDQSLVAENGERYSRLMATRTDDYAFVYTYNGQEIKVNMGKIKGQEVKASWFNPRTGETTKIGVVENRGVQTFRPEGAPEDGNDWVLILDSL